MKIHHILICFFLTLQDGNTGLISAEELIYTGSEGGNVTVGCSFPFSGSRKFFCKGECTTGNILIETTNDRAQSGRYSIEYKEGSFPSTSTVLSVSITQLKKSDSGRYSCALDRPYLPDSYEEIEIRVTEASTTSKPNSRLRPSTKSLPSSSTPTTTTQSLSSSSGNFTPSSSSTETREQTETGSPAGSGSLLYVRSTLVAMIPILLVAVLIFCRKRLKKLKGCAVETAYDYVGEEDSTYQSLHPDTRDQDQTYSTITQMH